MRDSLVLYESFNTLSWRIRWGRMVGAGGGDEMRGVGWRGGGGAGGHDAMGKEV